MRNDELLSFCLFAVIEKYDYVFSENGLVAYKDGKFLSKQVSVKFSTVRKRNFLNKILIYLYSVVLCNHPFKDQSCCFHVSPVNGSFIWHVMFNINNGE